MKPHPKIRRHDTESLIKMHYTTDAVSNVACPFSVNVILAIPFIIILQFPFTTQNLVYSISIVSILPILAKFI